MSFLAEGPGARPWGSSPGKPWGAQALADDEFAMILWRRLRHIKGMFFIGAFMGYRWIISGIWLDIVGHVIMPTCIWV